MDAADRAIYEYWMEKSAEERIRAGCSMGDGERAILEWIAPKNFSLADKRQFVFYHSYGYELPEEARRAIEERFNALGHT